MASAGAILSIMFALSPQEEAELCADIAARVMKAKALAAQWDLTQAQLQEFVTVHRERITALRDKLNAPAPEQADDTVTPDQLDKLWISKKHERLKRLEVLSDILYQDAVNGGLSGADLATSVREFRSYLTVAANELGQLMHRGSGEAVEGTTVGYTITGVDVDSMR